MAFGRGSPPPPAPPAEAQIQDGAAPAPGPSLTPDDLVAAVNKCAKQIYLHTDGAWQNVDPQWIMGLMMHAAQLLQFMPQRPANANQQPPAKGKAN